MGNQESISLGGSGQALSFLFSPDRDKVLEAQDRLLDRWRAPDLAVLERVFKQSVAVSLLCGRGDVKPSDPRLAYKQRSLGFMDKATFVNLFLTLE